MLVKGATYLQQNFKHQFNYTAPEASYDMDKLLHLIVLHECNYLSMPNPDAGLVINWYW